MQVLVSRGQTLNTDTSGHARLCKYKSGKKMGGTAVIMAASTYSHSSSGQRLNEGIEQTSGQLLPLLLHSVPVEGGYEYSPF